MISRRQFLVGSSAAAVGAGAAATQHFGWTRIAHFVGLDSSPDAHAPRSNVSVRTFRFASERVSREVEWAIAVPDVTPTATILCLHGRGEDHHYAFDAVRVQDFVADANVPFAVVSVDGGPDSFWHPRANGTDSQAMVTDELMPRVAEHLGATVPTALLGWSMGGYGALLAAAKYPEMFLGVCATSPALWSSYPSAASGAFDSDENFTANNVMTEAAALRDQHVRIDCGTGDPFVDMSREFAQKLPNAITGFSHGYHDAPYWRSRVPKQIESLQTWLG